MCCGNNIEYIRMAFNLDFTTNCFWIEVTLKMQAPLSFFLAQSH